MNVEEPSASIEQEWKTQEWLGSARELIRWSHSVSTSNSFILIVRHSHREAIASYDEMVGRGLTALGHRMAKEFGRKLPVRKGTQIFHSCVPRCGETAEDIAEGIRDTGGQVEFVEASDLLVGPRVVDPQLWQNLGRDGIHVIEFVEDWQKGVFTGKQIEPFKQFKARVVRDLVWRVRSAPAGSMHLHVTHDLFLVAARRILQTTSSNSKDRPPYLGGFGVVVRPSK